MITYLRKIRRSESFYGPFLRIHFIGGWRLASSGCWVSLAFLRRAGRRLFSCMSSDRCFIGAFSVNLFGLILAINRRLFLRDTGRNWPMSRSNCEPAPAFPRSSPNACRSNLR